MAASNSGGPISGEAAQAFGEGIGLVWGRWTALQMAVENQWGGRDSRAKADQFGESILSWFCGSKGTHSSFSTHSPIIYSSLRRDPVCFSGPHYYEDLVDMMYDYLSENFNADFEDNSVEEVIIFPVHSFPA
ncbi:hypothetical protein HU200_054308 [Digitaria exilis]|uniref:Pre-rRNA-processing protein TSR2 homolog n=1 Tax=Digitaria exilis TaxID=1010633 RepID=A0A835AQU3_9POAL|nr:hypothetical protein HU200_054308 [Digitaria exilis]